MATAEHISNEDIIRQFKRSDDAFLTAPEIAEELGLTRQAITFRLKQLHSEGRVERKEAGSRAVGWWLSET